MEIVRKRVLEKPGVLPQLVAQLRMGDVDQQSKAAEMLFCVVGQGPGRDVAATKQVLVTLCLSIMCSICKDMVLMQAVIMEPYGKDYMLLCFALTACGSTSLGHTTQ